MECGWAEYGQGDQVGYGDLPGETREESGSGRQQKQRKPWNLQMQQGPPII